MIIESYRSNRNIPELSRIFGIPWRTVGSVIKKIHEFGSVENRSGRGRERLFNRDRDNTQLSRVTKQNRRGPLQDITAINNEGNEDHNFCKKIVQRKSNELGYKRRMAKKQVVLREVNEKKWVA